MSNCRQPKGNELNGVFGGFLSQNVGHGFFLFENLFIFILFHFYYFPLSFYPSSICVHVMTYRLVFFMGYVKVGTNVSVSCSFSSFPSGSLFFYSIVLAFVSSHYILLVSLRTLLAFWWYKKGVDPDRSGDGKELGGVEGEGNHIRHMLFEKKESLFSLWRK